MPVLVKRVHLHPGMGLFVCWLEGVFFHRVLCVWLQVCKGGDVLGEVLHPHVAQGCVCALAGAQFCPGVCTRAVARRDGERASVPVAVCVCQRALSVSLHPAIVRVVMGCGCAWAWRWQCWGCVHVRVRARWV